MIPVLGLPLLNRADLAADMLDSVAVEVGETLVILNGEADQARQRLADWDVTFVEPGCNLGVAASWNHIIRARPAAPWWLIVNADITFGSDDLERLCEAMDDPDPRLVCLFMFSAWLKENYPEEFL